MEENTENNIENSTVIDEKNSTENNSDNVNNPADVNPIIEKVDSAEFEDFIELAKQETKNAGNADNSSDNNDAGGDSVYETKVTEAHKMLASSFVDLLQFVTEFAIENTIFKEYEEHELPAFEAFSQKDRKHLQNAWAGLISYYNLEKLFSPLLTAGIITVTCVFGAIKQAKNIKKTLPKKDKTTQKIQYSNQLTLFEDTVNNTASSNTVAIPAKKRGRPRKNANIV